MAKITVVRVSGIQNGSGSARVVEATHPEGFEVEIHPSSAYQSPRIGDVVPLERMSDLGDRLSVFQPRR